MSRNKHSTNFKNKQSTSVSGSDSILEGNLTQKDELPGVDYKNKLGPRSLRHQRLNLSTTAGENRFLCSVTQELSKKTNIRNIQSTFQHSSSDTGAATACKTVFITNQDISAKLSSPLFSISSPCYIQKWKDEQLTKELPSSFEDDDNSTERHARPTVLAVNLRWRNGIQVKQAHKYTTKTIQLDPVMKKTEFEYDSKLRFTSQLNSECEQLFPDWKKNLMILDGNESHGQSFAGFGDKKVGASASAKSDRLEQDASPAAPSSQNGDPFTREWKELTDLKEHKVLVVPYHSRSGFDADLGKRYQFPYQAKFTVGKKTYQHRFILQVPLSQSPQHYGLIFTFSEDPKGHSKLRIKSMLTVYSVFPVSPRNACLETYASSGESDNDASPHASPGESKSKKTQSARAAKTAVELLSDNLEEQNMISYKFDQSLHVERGLAQPGQTNPRHRRLYNETLTGKKQKKKQHILKNIKLDHARM